MTTLEKLEAFLCDAELNNGERLKLRELFIMARLDALQERADGERREIAARIMAGFAAAPELPPATRNNIADLSREAVRWADALIVALNKEKP